MSSPGAILRRRPIRRAPGLPPGLSLASGNTIFGQCPTQAGNYQFTVTTTNASGSTSTTVNLNVVAAAGNITRELWTGAAVTGPNITDIPLLSASPNTTDTTLTTLEDTTAFHANNTGDDVSAAISTLPATGGNYYFWVAASNAAELWISNSSEPVAKVRRAYVTGPTGTAARTWNTQATQKSGWLALTGGQKYYFEVIAQYWREWLQQQSFRRMVPGIPTGNTPNAIAQWRWTGLGGIREVWCPLIVLASVGQSAHDHLSWEPSMLRACPVSAGPISKANWRRASFYAGWTAAIPRSFT